MSNKLFLKITFQEECLTRSWSNLVNPLKKYQIQSKHHIHSEIEEINFRLYDDLRYIWTKKQYLEVCNIKLETHCTTNHKKHFYSYVETKGAMKAQTFGGLCNKTQTRPTWLRLVSDLRLTLNIFSARVLCWLYISIYDQRPKTKTRNRNLW